MNISRSIGIAVTGALALGLIATSLAMSQDRDKDKKDKEKQEKVIDPPKDGDEVGVITTSMGTIVVKFFPDKAPKHVENFKKLANDKFYDGTQFHRVIPGFMIQGGDPNTKGTDKSTYGTGGPGWTVKAEFNDVKHERGILSMARAQDPDSAGSQFFIMVKEYPSLDHQYSAFGKVVTGMDVVDKIVNTPRDNRDLPKTPVVMKTVRIEKWPLKEDKKDEKKDGGGGQ